MMKVRNMRMPKRLADPSLLPQARTLNCLILVNETYQPLDLPTMVRLRLTRLNPIWRTKMREFHVPAMKCSDCVRKITHTAHTRDREAIVHADTAKGYLAIDSPLPAEIFADIISDLGYRITAL